MDDAELAAIEHENFIVTMSLAADQMPDARVGREDGVAYLLTGHPLLLLNQIVTLDGDGSRRGIEEAVEVARGRGHHFIVSLRRGVDDDLIPTVRALGLELLADEPWIPGMAMDPIPEDAGLPPNVEPGLDIRQIHDEQGVDDHIRAAAAGFELPDDMLRSIVTLAGVETPGAAYYVGYLDGEPMVSGLGLRTGRAIGVYNIATAPAARRRGFGAAMTARVIADGVAAGCDVAILQASDMGRPIYERMGFRTVVEYMGYVEPTPPADEATPEG